MKLDPSNTELLAQKQRLLTDVIKETKEKLETLKTAAQSTNEQLVNGEISQEQYDALQREIVETEEKLKSLETQAATTSATLAKIEEVGGKLQSVDDKISGVGIKLTTAVIVPLVVAGTAAVKTAVDFESSMSQVQATMGFTADSMSEVDGQTVNIMDTLSALAKEMGASHCHLVKTSARVFLIEQGT